MKTLEEIQTEMVQNIYDVFENDADKYFIDGDLRDSGVTGCGIFFEKDGKIILKNDDIQSLNPKYDLLHGRDEVETKNLYLAQEIGKWFIENGHPLPNRFRMIFDTSTKKLDVDYAYATPDMLEDTDESTDKWNEWISREKWIEEIENQRKSEK
ncbi:MAG: hypothetical protein WAX22_06570 [Lactococcus hircilactis]